MNRAVFGQADHQCVYSGQTVVLRFGRVKGGVWSVYILGQVLDTLIHVHSPETVSDKSEKNWIISRSYDRPHRREILQLFRRDATSGYDN